MTPVSRDLGDLVARVGRHWGWMLGFAILTVIAGILVVVWPGETVLIVSILFGAQLVVAAIFRFVAAFAAPDEHAWARVLMALVGVLSLIAGLYLLRHPYVAVLVVGVLLGLYWMATGFTDLFIAIGYRGLPGRGWTILTAILSVVAGAIVLLAPGPSLVIVAWVLGIWLVVLGVMLGVQSFMVLGSVRRVQHTTATA